MLRQEKHSDALISLIKFRRTLAKFDRRLVILPDGFWNDQFRIYVSRWMK